MPLNINKILEKSKVSLEKKAKDRFGANVNTDSGELDYNSQVDSSTNGSVTPRDWNTTHYASALVLTDTVDFNPKLKFMFKVSFKIDPAMYDFARDLGFDASTLQQNLSFVVRHVDRPKIDADYEEVNMYNFRTKVLKSVRQREVTLTVYDDVGNNALSFVNLYRQLLQPIARMHQDPLATHEDFGFSFGQDLDTAMRGPLPNGRKNILTEMTIHQIFVERGSDVQDAASWVKVVNFTFTNPRFTNIDIDDLDHENGGNFNIITFSVDFDTWYQDNPQTLSTQSDGPSFNLGDVANSGTNASSSQGGGKTITQQMMNQGISTVATTPYYPLSSGGGGDQSVNGLLQDSRQRTMNNMIQSRMPSISRPNSPPVYDTTVEPSKINDLTEQIFSNDGEIA